MRRTFSRFVAVIGFASAALCLASPVHAKRVVPVGPPSGADDTMAIQTALDDCVDATDQCVVQLEEGTYFTSQLLTHNFRGTFRGASQDLTVVEPLPDLRADFDPSDPCVFVIPPSEDYYWPDLVIFVDGDITVSDMTFRVSSLSPTQAWGFWGFELQELLSVVRVMATTPATNVTIERITAEGLFKETSLFGYNLINCVIIAGEYPVDSPTCGDWDADRYPFIGRIAVKDSDFKGCASPSAISHVYDSKVQVSNNVGDDVLYGLELSNVEGSKVDAAFNHYASTQVGAILYSAYYPGEYPTAFFIHDNYFAVSGPWAWDGIALFDNDAGPKYLDVTLAGNVVEVEGVAGIEAVSTEGVLMVGNRVAGTGAAGILVEAGTDCSLLTNDVAAFAPSEELGKIILDGDTSDCLVVGRYDAGDVVDLGQDNVVVANPAGP